MFDYNFKRKLRSRYSKFFKEASINSKSGVLHKNKKLKFATLPYIGRKYGQSPKILFIGLDIGSDENPGRGIISFHRRRHGIGNEKSYREISYNPHIAGTLVTAAYFAYGNKVWAEIRAAKSYKGAIKILHKIGLQNPLSNIAITNFYKFVTKNRVNKAGAQDRKYIFPEHEQELLLDEIKIFNPQIIIFQSVDFIKNGYRDFLKKLKLRNQKIKTYSGPHPSYRGSRKPKEYLKKIKLMR